MAARCRRLCLHFLVLFWLIFCLLHSTYGIKEYMLTCNDKLDMSKDFNIHSGILNVKLPDDFSKYLNDPGRSTVRNCDIQIIFSGNQQLQIELFFLDIVPKDRSRVSCSTGLEVLQQNENRNVYGKPLCMEGWEWEEQHRELSIDQKKREIMGSPVTFRLISEDGAATGEGFKVHFNEFTPYGCQSLTQDRMFKCEEKTRCVHEDLTCDGWNDCGDDSDEDEDAGCGLLTATEIVGVITGILLVLGTTACLAVFFIAYRSRKYKYGLRSDSKIPINHWDIQASVDPIVVFNHNRYNSQESGMNKSGLSRRRDSDTDSLRKENLDKLDRMSSRFGDNMSERSYKSKKSQARSLTSVPPPEPVKIVGRYNIRSQSSDKLNRDRYDRDESEDESGDDRRYRRRSRERDYRRSDSEESDYDRDDDRRRRRSSRDRHHRDRYDDRDDYDSDREYRDRRHHRDRSRRRYSDDEDESDRSYRKRESSRDRYDRDRSRRDDSRDRSRRDDNRDRSRRDDSRDRNRHDDSRGRNQLDDSRDRNRHDDSRGRNQLDDSRDRARLRRDDSRDRLGRDRKESPDRRRNKEETEDERSRQRVENDLGDDRNKMDRAYKSRGNSRERKPSEKAQTDPRAAEEEDGGPSKQRFKTGREAAPPNEGRVYNGYEGRRSRSRENIRQRDERPATPPKSSEIPRNTSAAPRPESGKKKWQPKNARRAAQEEDTNGVYEDVNPSLRYKEEAV